MVARACNPSYLGGWGRRIAWTQEAEVAVSRDRAIALQPGQQECNSVSKINKLINKSWPDAMARAYNSSTWGDWRSQIAWAQEFKKSLGNIANPVSKQTNK